MIVLMEAVFMAIQSAFERPIEKTRFHRLKSVVSAVKAAICLVALMIVALPVALIVAALDPFKDGDDPR